MEQAKQQNTTMQSVIKMNDNAAVMMENGKQKEAILALDAALSVMRKSIGKEGEHDEIAISVQNPLRDAQHPKKPISSYTVEMGNDFVYKSPIRSHMLEEGVDSFTMSIVIVFNMALANHLQALESKERKTERLKKALKLYELSFCMQMKGSGKLNMTQVLALVNNCGQAYKALNLPKKANRFFQHMLSTIMAMIEIGEAEDVEEMDGFISSASQLILVDPALAPAA